MSSGLKPCPQCGQATNVIPIVYGLPNARTLARASRGEVALGGCEIIEDAPMPTLRCLSCSVDFDGAIVVVRVE